jgi:PAS domain S-box-containing protein
VRGPQPRARSAAPPRSRLDHTGAGSSSARPPDRGRRRNRVRTGPERSSVLTEQPSAGDRRPDGDAAPDPTESAARALQAELAIEAAGIGSFDYDLVTGRLVWDERLIELFGYQQEGFAGTIGAFFARLHPEDVERTAAALQATIDDRGDLDVEYRVTVPGGDTRWVQGRGRVLVDDDGRPVRLLGAAYDTTRQRHGDARVARVLETMSAAFISLDRDWRFDYVNAEAERLLGRSRSELRGGVLWELFPAAVGSPFEEHYRASAEAGEPRSFEAHYPEPLDAWYEVRAFPNPDGLSVYFVEVTERRKAQEHARRGAERLSLIVDTSTRLSAVLGVGGSEDAALEQVAEAVVPRLGDWVVVTLADADGGRMRDVAMWHRDPGMRAVVDRYARLRLRSVQSDAPIWRALASGEPMVVPDVPRTVGDLLPAGEVRDMFLALAPQSAVAQALTARGRTVGAISIYRSADRPSFDAEDVTTVTEVASRVALALDNARLNAQQRRLAEGLQRSMLTDPPETDWAEIVVRYDPAVEAAEVGGDWYDAFVQPDGATMLVIGDVVGHDTEAAAAMGQLRGLLRGIAYREGSGPGDVLTGLDCAMQGLGVRAMATAAIVRLDRTDAGTTRLRWSNAGHPPPLVLHADGRVERLVGERPELMLGVDAGAPRSELVTEVGPGETVLLYTDGLVEGRGLPLDDGLDLLTTAVGEFADRPLPELCDAVVERVRPAELQDDVALVAVRLR